MAEKCMVIYQHNRCIWVGGDTGAGGNDETQSDAWVGRRPNVFSFHMWKTTIRSRMKYKDWR